MPWPSIVEVDPRADSIRGVTSRLDGVNPRETENPLGEIKSIRGPVSARISHLEWNLTRRSLATGITCGDRKKRL